ncbi:MAG: PQQ-dependent sugar dehydrogenase [Gammaproteobacteria bacterium]|nr:PQQ-dependent sugar dehydrogenase [Gammaproteobacteria bacterium]
MTSRLIQRAVFAFVISLILLLFTSCEKEQDSDRTPVNNIPAKPASCDHDNGGLILPDGFCAGIVADNLGFIRHLVVNNNGDLYVTLRNQRLNLGGIIGLRDTDQDGKMDRMEKFSDIPGMGIAVHSGYLYFAADRAIYRYKLIPGELIPMRPPQIIVSDLPEQSLHAGKSFAMDDSGWIYVNIGAPSNACQADDQVTGSAGMDPCPQLDKQGGIWRFSATINAQTQDKDGYRFASGIRNAYAIAWHPSVNQLYIVQHGRDQLNELWPGLYTAEQGAKLPAEEFLLVKQDGIYGWPYCYYDQIQSKWILAPEYGGNGETTDRCAQYPEPLIAFPGHYGPNDLKFYTGKQFPERYHNGAFIAFHGSYNRGPYEQVGYQVVFVPFQGTIPSGDWEVFIDGFAGAGSVTLPEDADYRPTGLAVGQDGSLYVSDSIQGRIWRIFYTGQ